MSNTNEIALDSGFGPTELDNQVADFIADVAKEFAAEADAPAEAPTPKLEAPETPGPQENTVADPTDRGLERLVAREVDLRERETKLNAAQEEIKALRSRLAELEPRAIAPELLDKIKLSPADGLRAIGLDPDEVVRTALMEKLGDKANTPEMKEMMERVRLRKEMEALRAQVQLAERKQAAQEYYNQVNTAARQYVSNIDGYSKQAPTVAQVAKSNPDRVHAEIMEEITRDAAYRAATEPNGDVISYQEAAQRVEKRWGAMKALLGGNSVDTGTPAASTPAVKTVEQTASAPKTPPATPKPPDRPLAPWLQRHQTEEEALNDAILEYRRLEHSKK